MKIKIAKYISVIGHPLLTIPLFVVSILFRFQDFNSALLISVLMVFGIILPLTIKMYRSEKKGVIQTLMFRIRQNEKAGISLLLHYWPLQS